MKLMFRYILFVLLFYVHLLSAQDIHYSQFFVNKLVLNPAEAGMFNGNVRTAVNYKDQWRTVTTPYKTFSLGVDKAFLQSNKSVNVGGGFLMSRDKAGDAGFGTFDASGILSGIVFLNDKMKFSGGLSIGYKQHSVNINNLQWQDQITTSGFDGSINHGDAANAFKPAGAIDVGMGAKFSLALTKNNMSANDPILFNAGISLGHLNRPSTSFFGLENRLSPKFIANVDGLVPLEGTNFSILPSFMMALQNKNNLFLFGSLVKYKLKEGSKYTGFEQESAISFGGHYRVKIGRAHV